MKKKSRQAEEGKWNRWGDAMRQLQHWLDKACQTHYQSAADHSDFSINSSSSSQLWCINVCVSVFGTYWGLFQNWSQYINGQLSDCVCVTCVSCCGGVASMDTVLLSLVKNLSARCPRLDLLAHSMTIRKHAWICSTLERWNQPRDGPANTVSADAWIFYLGHCIWFVLPERKAD